MIGNLVVVLLLVDEVFSLAPPSRRYTHNPAHTLPIPFLNNRVEQIRENIPLNSNTLVLAPKSSRSSEEGEAAIVFLPGCLVKPNQYRSLATSTQDASEQALWFIVPDIPLGVPNPLTVNHSIRNAVECLRKMGFSGEKIFVGGHSLGAAFLLEQLDQDSQLRDSVSGVIHFGSFPSRIQHNSWTSDPKLLLPTLTVVGDQDGLVRTSRIAEALHYLRTTTMTAHAKSASTGEEQSLLAQLHHPVVLVKGMNHFQVLDGEPHFMKKLCDLEAEISDSRAHSEVADTMAAFVALHSTGGVVDETSSCTSSLLTARLLSKVKRTATYLAPMLEALSLEGNYFLRISARQGNSNEERKTGSPWTEFVQVSILDQVAGLQQAVDSIHVHDSNLSCYDVSLLPSIVAKDQRQGSTASTNGRDSIHLEATTVTEAVYNKLATVFDTGFFPRSASELRCKLNSLPAVAAAAGLDPHPENSSMSPNNNCFIAGVLNNRTIAWAWDHAPESVRRRYIERGVPIVAASAPDVAHSSGPYWMWSSLDFQLQNDEDPRMVVRSHTLTTPLHLPFIGGFLYMKLLSPARVLDWMYTDSLRCAKRQQLLQKSSSSSHNGRNCTAEPTTWLPHPN